MNKVILVGGFNEIIELCERCNKEIVGIIDNKLVESYRGYPILGTDNDAEALFELFGKIPLLITPDNPTLRLKLVEKYRNIGFSFLKIISPDAFISPSAKIGKGVIIQSSVNISANVIVEDFVKVNVMANIMHDSKIGSFTTIAPNAVILGYVNIDEKCYIGANSTILPNKQVTQGSIVGAGSVVTKDILTSSTVKGNPAKA